MKCSCSSSLGPQLPIHRYWQRKPVTIRNFKKLNTATGEKAVCMFLAVYSGWWQERKVLFWSTVISAQVASAWKRKTGAQLPHIHHRYSRSLKLLLPPLRDMWKWAKSKAGGGRTSQLSECSWEVPSRWWLVLRVSRWGSLCCEVLLLYSLWGAVF